MYKLIIEKKPPYSNFHLLLEINVDILTCMYKIIKLFT